LGFEQEFFMTEGLADATLTKSNEHKKAENVINTIQKITLDGLNKSSYVYTHNIEIPVSLNRSDEVQVMDDSKRLPKASRKIGQCCIQHNVH